MYTRCTHCGSIYQVDARTLRQAAGQVRCGDCDEFFDALELLSESFPDAPAHLRGDPIQDDLAEPIADLFAGIAPSDAPQDPEALDPGLSDPTVAEGDGVAEDGAAVDDGTDDDGPWMAEPTGEDWTRDDPVPATQLDALAAPALEEDDDEDGDEDPVMPEADAADAIVPGDEALEDEVEDEVGELAAQEPPAPPPEVVLGSMYREARPRSGTWVALLIVAAALLSAQWVHAERRSLVQHPTVGPQLAELYALIGTELHPPWTPELLLVERAEMVSHPSVPGALFLSAVLTNEGAYAVPLPQMRLKMDNRWGDVLAAREFAPGEYLLSPRPVDVLLAPGERVAMGVEILDPDPEAVGFRIQVCLDDLGVVRCR